MWLADVSSMYIILTSSCSTTKCAAEDQSSQGTDICRTCACCLSCFLWLMWLSILAQVCDPPHSSHYCHSSTAKESSTFYCNVAKRRHGAGWVHNPRIAWLATIEVYWNLGRLITRGILGQKSAHINLLRTYTTIMSRKEPCVIFQSLLRWSSALKSHR